MHFLVLWPLEGSYSVIGEKQIVDPKKPCNEICVEEDVTAVYQGKKYPAKIVKKSENKQELQTEMVKIISDLTFKRKTATEDSKSVTTEDKKCNATEGGKSVSTEDGRLEATSQPAGNETSRPKKKKLSEVHECNSVEKEVKELKVKEGRKRKEIMQLREETVMEMAEELLSSSTCGCHSVKDQLNRIEKKVDVLSVTYETLLGCRSCLKKVYKKIDADAKPVVVPAVSSAPASPSHDKSPDSNSDEATVMDEKRKMPCPEIEEKKGPTYLGDARYNVRIPTETLRRCEKISKSGEKLALNLLEHILSPEEIQTVTVYGNRQHGKQPMEENKRRALRSHIASVFPDADWERITLVVNDKIRKLRKKQENIQ